MSTDVQTEMVFSEATTHASETLLTQMCAEIHPSEVRAPSLLHTIPSEISKRVFFMFGVVLSEAEEYFFLVRKSLIGTFVACNCLKDRLRLRRHLQCS